MRIVDVAGFYAPLGGGVKSYIDRKFWYAARSGHELVVIAPGKTETIEERAGGYVHWLPTPALPVDRRYRMFIHPEPIHRLLDSLKPDVVEASSPWKTAGIVADWKGDAPRSWIMHADPLAAYAYRWFGGLAERETIDRSFGWFWNYLRRLGPRFDRVVCASDWLSGRLREGGLRHAQTIRFGIDSDIFSPARRDEALRARLLDTCGLPPEATLLLGVGRHSPEKNWPLVIDAVHAAGAERPIGLVLAGDGRDRRKLKRAIGGNPHIRLIAPVTSRPEFATLMASADALIHGCGAETYCLVAAEARASGLPLIVPDNGGAPELGIPGAFVQFDSRDFRSAVGGIHRLLDKLPQARAAAAAAAPGPRLLDDHFRELFALYAQDASARRHAA